MGACVLAVYLALLYGVYVPDWKFTVHNPDSIYNGTTLTVSFPLVVSDTLCTLMKWEHKSNTIDTLSVHKIHELASIVAAYRFSKFLSTLANLFSLSILGDLWCQGKTRSPL